MYRESRYRELLYRELLYRELLYRELLYREVHEQHARVAKNQRQIFGGLVSLAALGYLPWRYCVSDSPIATGGCKHGLATPAALGNASTGAVRLSLDPWFQ